MPIWATQELKKVTTFLKSDKASDFSSIYEDILSGTEYFEGKRQMINPGLN